MTGDRGTQDEERAEKGSPRLRRPSQATVVAWLALFVALGGVASGLPGRGTVDSRDIVNETVRGKDVREDAIGSSELAPRSVGRAAMAPNAIAGPQVLDASLGPTDFGPVPTARVGTPQEAPGCADQLVPSGNNEIVQFSLEDFDTEDLHAEPPAGCGPRTQSRLRAPIDGIYEVSGGLAWATDPNGRRAVDILRTQDGDTQTFVSDYRGAVSGAGTVQSVSTVMPMERGSYVQLRAYQDSDSALELDDAVSTFLTMAWIAPAP